MLKDDFLGSEKFKSLSDNNAVLRKLSKVPCRNLVAIARQILKGERKIKVPGVKQRVSVRVFKRKSDDCSGVFRPYAITLFLGNGAPLATLVHEMRHAQQLSILGTKGFYAVVPFADFLDPLEIDAVAAEIANGVMSPRTASLETLPGKDKGLAKLRKGLGRVHAAQARAIGNR